MAAPRLSTEIDLGGQRVEHPPSEASKAWQKANSVFCPLGPASTTAWIVMLRGALTSLSTTAAHTLTWKLKKTTQDNASNQTTTTVNFQGMYIKHSERLFIGADSFANALYLVELVDARYLAANVSNSGNVVSNLRTHAHSQEFLAGSTQYNSWEQLLEALWLASTYLGAWPGLPGSLPIDGKPNNRWAVGKNAYRQLNEILNFLDCAIKPNLNGTFSVVQLGDTQTISANSDTLRFNSDPIGNQIGIAANLAIYRMKHLKSYGQERDTEYNNNWSLNGFYQTDTVATNVTDGHGTQALWDDLPAIIDENGQDENTADINTRNSNIALRYKTRNSVVSRHRIHYGLFGTDYLPGGQIRATLWRNWGLKDAKENTVGSTVTEFIAGTNLLAGFSPGESVSGFHDLGLYNEAYLPPDLERNTFPNYPRIANIVQIWHDSAIPGEGVDATQAYGLHKGRVRRWVNNSMDVMEECWVLIVNDYDNKLGKVKMKQGACLGPARLSGITTDEGQTLPVYTVSNVAEVDTTLAEFVLTDNLFLGGTATATLTLDEENIIVADPFNDQGCWMAYVGSKGLGRKVLDRTVSEPARYDVVFMERPALIMEAHTNTDRNSTGSAISSTIDMVYQQGGKRTPEDLANQGSIDIDDTYKIYPYAAKNGRSLSVWNDVRSQREILVCQQVGLIAKAELNQQISAERDTENVAIRQNTFKIVTFSPFNLAPETLPTVVQNPLRLYGRIGDEVYLLWDETLNTQGEGGYCWIIIQVNDPGKLVHMIQINELFKEASEPVKPTVTVFGNFKGFNANIVTYGAGGISVGPTCIFVPGDYDETDLQADTVLENRRIYGPARWAGDSEGGAIIAANTPIYVGETGHFEYEGHSGSNIDKGSPGTFTLHKRDGGNSSVTVEAECRYNKYKTNKKAMIARIAGKLIANQIEN